MMFSRNVVPKNGEIEPAPAAAAGLLPHRRRLRNCRGAAVEGSDVTVRFGAGDWASRLPGLS